MANRAVLLFLLPKDVDALYKEFTLKNTIIDLTPTDQSWGNREMYIKDPDENSIRFTQWSNKENLNRLTFRPGFFNKQSNKMKIGIIGAGEIGGTLIRQYSRAGHSVKMANSSGTEKLKSLALETGASAVTLADVVTDVDVIVITIPLIRNT